MTYAASPLPGAFLRACAAAGVVAAAEIALLLISASSGDSPGAFAVGGLILLVAFLAATFMASLHMLLAVPLYLCLSARRPVGTPAAAAAGFLIGAFPIPLLTPAESPIGQDSLGVFLFYGFPGLAAGFVFGRHLRRRGAEPKA